MRLPSFRKKSRDEAKPVATPKRSMSDPGAPSSPTADRPSLPNLEASTPSKSKPEAQSQPPPDPSQYTIPCQAIVSYSEHDWRWESLLTREPLEDEFLVEMIATGVCHTDISGYGGIYPRVYGHEGAGRILRLGSPTQSPTFNKDDLVILSAASCQSCHYCRTGHPAYCAEHAGLTLHANEPNFVLASDTSKVVGGGYFGQSSFASVVSVKVSSATNVTRMVKDVDELKLYAPLGCGLMTGAGAITHVGKVGPRDVVAVIGLGGVGLAGVCAAKERHARTIIAVDVLPSRIELAKEVGATVGVLSSEEALAGEELSEVLKRHTPEGLGCTHILDTTPSVRVLSQCLDALQKNGEVLQVGVKQPAGAKLEVDTLAHMVNGRRLIGVIEGDRDPTEAIPELVQLGKAGILPLEKFLTEFPVQDFELAKVEMEKGNVIKSVLIW